jgi:hypothetical protein
MKREFPSGELSLLLVKQEDSKRTLKVQSVSDSSFSSHHASGMLAQ